MELNNTNHAETVAGTVLSIVFLPLKETDKI